MTTNTTDDVTYLRALLAEQTARAERAEAALTSIGFLIEADPSRDLVDEVREGVIAAEADAARAEKAEAERDAALAANAEMRAALEEIVARGNEQRGTGRMIETAEAALSRPDPGAGVVVTGPLDALVDNLVRVVCDCHDGSDLWAHTRQDPDAFRRAVRGALLKKGGG